MGAVPRRAQRNVHSDERWDVPQARPARLRHRRLQRRREAGHLRLDRRLCGRLHRPKELWIQTADGGFVDRAAELGISDPGGRGRQPTTLNANSDNWPDLFTGEARGVDFPSPNRLWVNQGGSGFANPPGLPTEDIGNQCDTAGDFDHDGIDELIVCGGDTFRVYDNRGGTWTDATGAVGLPVAHAGTPSSPT